MFDLILASRSKARAHLLTSAGIAFRQIPSDDPEPSREPDEPLDAFVIRLAERKARRVFADHPDAVILAADTALGLDGDTLGKPADEAAAIDMLLRMAGRTHRLASGIAVLSPKTPSPLTACDIAEVRMRPWNRERITRYVRAARPFRYAGGYALQEEGAVMVEHIRGDPNTVIGLPMGRTEDLLRKAGFTGL